MELDLQAVQRLLRERGVSEIGIARVLLVLRSDPARNVQGRAGNWHGEFPSRKMGLTISWESKYVERRWILLLEFDEDTLFYVSQPSPKLVIRYLLPSGRRSGARITADLFVGRTDFIGYLELKDEATLLKLAASAPYRYVRADDGTWSSPPGIEAAAEFGVGFKVFSTAQLPKNLSRNLDFLRDYLYHQKGPPETIPHAADLTSRLGSDAPILLSEAIAILGNADDVYWGVLTHRWHIDLRRAPLAEVDSALVFPSAEAAQRHFKLAMTGIEGLSVRDAPSPEADDVYHWDGQRYSVANVGESAVFMRSDDARILDLPRSTFSSLQRSGALVKTGLASSLNCNTAGLELLKRLRTSDLDEALSEKLPLLQRKWSGESIPESTVPGRTLNEWDKNYRAAQREFGLGILGIAARNCDKGNRDPRIEPEHAAIREQAVKDVLEQKLDNPISSGYAVYFARAEAAGFTPQSETAFCDWYAKRDRPDAEKARRGKRAAYALKPPVKAAEDPEPPEGDRTWALGHLDHTEVGIHLRCLNSTRLVARAWLSLLIDAYSRGVLAYWLSFLHPSQAACFMVFRDCVRRWGRLPSAIVTDEGREFNGNRIRCFLGLREIEHFKRPTTEPRFGNPVERMNLTLETLLNLDIAGSNQNLKNVRMASSTHDPRILAHQTIVTYGSKLETFLFTEYPEHWHRLLGCKVKDRFEEGLVLSGQRSFLAIDYDPMFIFQTLAEAKRWGGRIDCRTGVHLNGHDYYHDDFRTWDVTKKAKGAPLFDLEDPTYIHVPFRGRSLRCDLIGSQLSRLPQAPAHRRFYLSEKLGIRRRPQPEKFAELRARAARIEEHIKEQGELGEALNEGSINDEAPPEPQRTKPSLGKSVNDLPPLLPYE